MLAEKRQHSTVLVPYTYYECSIPDYFPFVPLHWHGELELNYVISGSAEFICGDERFINEPHVGGGNPVASSKGTSYFNDALGTTVGSKSNGKYSPAALTAFGEDLTVHSPTPTQNSNFFTGKPFVEGLGHAFLMRNYRAGLAKWQSADPMGYPDGWNRFAYCGNGVTSAVDLWGCNEHKIDAVIHAKRVFSGRGAPHGAAGRRGGRQKSARRRS